MRILHLSTSDANGGAARAAFRLHTGLLQLQHQSRMLVLRNTTGRDDVQKLVWSDDLLTRFRRRRRRRQMERDLAPYRGKVQPQHDMFSDDRSEVGYDLVRQLPPCDIINLHWVAGMIDFNVFFSHLPDNVPIVWRMADMNVFTGGCHYDAGCGKFRQRCGACPALQSLVEDDLSRRVWGRKHVALNRIPPQRMHIVGTSRWIAEQAGHSSLLGRFARTVIPNGLDAEVFAPRGKQACRQKLGIPQDAKVVLFVAESAKNPRKGFAQLSAALQQLAGEPKLFLLSVGGHATEVPGMAQKHLGRIADDSALAEAYSSADVFVIPSLQESFGQTVIESLACGTPVVGFNTGGIPDMVRPGETGQLVAVGDAAALAAAIAQVLNDSNWQAMSQRCRAAALADYTIQVQAKRYVKLYESLREAATPASGTPAIAPMPPPIKPNSLLNRRAG